MRRSHADLREFGCTAQDIDWSAHALLSPSIVTPLRVVSTWWRDSLPQWQVPLGAIVTTAKYWGGEENRKLSDQNSHLLPATLNPSCPKDGRNKQELDPSPTPLRRTVVFVAVMLRFQVCLERVEMVLRNQLLSTHHTFAKLYITSWFRLLKSCL